MVSVLFYFVLYLQLELQLQSPGESRPDTMFHDQLHRIPGRPHLILNVPGSGGVVGEG